MMVRNRTWCIGNKDTHCAWCSVRCKREDHFRSYFGAKRSSGLPEGLCPNPLAPQRDKRHGVHHGSGECTVASGEARTSQRWDIYSGFQSVPFLQHAAVPSPWLSPLPRVSSDTKLPQIRQLGVTCMPRPYDQGAVMFWSIHLLLFLNLAISSGPSLSGLVPAYLTLRF